MNKYISVNKEGIKALQRTFKINGEAISERCVKNALAYRSDSELARKIRFTAIKHHGGCTYYILEEGEFFFDSDSCWRASIQTALKSISINRPAKVLSTVPKETWWQGTIMLCSPRSTKSSKWRQLFNFSNHGIL